MSKSLQCGKLGNHDDSAEGKNREQGTKMNLPRRGAKSGSYRGQRREEGKEES